MTSRLGAFRRDAGSGQMNGILRDGMRQLMAKSAASIPIGWRSSAQASPGASARRKIRLESAVEPRQEMDQEFIGVTHSLGSYLLFNTLNPENMSPHARSVCARSCAEAAEDSAMQYIFERTSQIYFFANQIEMLEITNLETAPSAAASDTNRAGSLRRPGSHQSCGKLSRARDPLGAFSRKLPGSLAPQRCIGPGKDPGRGLERSQRRIHVARTRSATWMW